MRLRVAHVLGSFGIGGGERVALDLAIGQRAAGADVAVVSLEEPADGPLAQDYAAHGIEIVRVHKKPGVDLSLVPRLALAFRRWRAEIVHTHNPPPLIYGAPASRIAGARNVHTKHGANAMPGRRRLLARAAARFTAAFVAVSQTTAETARRGREVDARRIVTIENGIDLSRFAAAAAARSDGAAHNASDGDAHTAGDGDARSASAGAAERAGVRAELGLPDGAFVVGTIGRLVPEKNQALLIDSLAPSLSPSLRLLLVGDGPERDRLRARVERLGERARWVTLLGERRDVPRLLAAFDAFALSSDSEGLPLVIVEAMASALPVVSTDVGGIGAVVVDGETGYLVPAANGGALGARLTALAAAPSLALRLGGEGRRRALARYSRERMVSDYFNVYERILKK
jgi:glycosyltransferase involved in cell wall biosynthesis